MVLCPTLSCVRELIWASFQSWVLLTETVPFGSTVQSHKNPDFACAGIKLSLSVRISRWTQALVCRVRYVMTHFYWVSPMSIKLLRICLLVSLVNISRRLCHFTELRPIPATETYFVPHGRMVRPGYSLGGGLYEAWTHDGHVVTSCMLTIVPRNYPWNGFQTTKAQHSKNLHHRKHRLRNIVDSWCLIRLLHDLTTNWDRFWHILVGRTESGGRCHHNFLKYCFRFLKDEQTRNNKGRICFYLLQEKNK